MKLSFHLFISTLVLSTAFTGLCSVNARAETYKFVDGEVTFDTDKDYSDNNAIGMFVAYSPPVISTVTVNHGKTINAANNTNTGIAILGPDHDIRFISNRQNGNYTINATNNNTAGINVAQGSSLSITGADINSTGNQAGGLSVSSNGKINITGNAGGSNTLNLSNNSGPSGLNISDSYTDNIIKDMNIIVTGNKTTSGSGGINVSNSSMTFTSNGNHVLVSSGNVTGMQYFTSFADIQGMNLHLDNNSNTERTGGTGLYIRTGSTVTISAIGNGNTLTANNNAGGINVDSSKMETKGMNIEASNNLDKTGTSGTGIYVSTGEINLAGNGSNYLKADNNTIGIRIRTDSLANISHMDISASNNRNIEGGSGQGILSESGSILNITGNSKNTLIADNNIYGLSASDAVVNIKDMNVILSNNINSAATGGLGIRNQNAGKINMEGNGKNLLLIKDNANGIMSQHENSVVTIKNMDVIIEDNITPAGGKAINIATGGAVKVEGNGNNLLKISGSVYGAEVNNENSRLEISNANIDISGNGNFSASNGVGLYVHNGGTANIKGNGRNLFSVKDNVRGIMLGNADTLLNIENMNIDISDNWLDGLFLSAASKATITGNGRTYLKVSDNGSNGIYVRNEESSLDINKMNLDVSNNTEGVGLYAVEGGVITINNSDMEIKNNNIGAAAVRYNSRLNIDGDAEGIGQVKNLYMGGNRVAGFTGNTGGVIDIKNMAVFSEDNILYKRVGDNAEFSLSNSIVNLTAQGAVAFDETDEGDGSDIIINNSTVFADNLFNAASNEFTLTADNSVLSGKAEGSDADMSLTDTTWNMLAGSRLDTLNINGGIINLSNKDEGVYNTLTVADFHAENNPLIVMNAKLEGDNSKSDKLVVTDDAHGNATLQVINNGGQGGITLGDGVLLVEVHDDSEASFALLGGKVDTGGYEYFLHQGGLNGNAGNANWYLRTDVKGAEYTDTFKTMANVPGMQSVMAKTGMNSLHKRMGDLRGMANEKDIHGAWGRFYAKKLTVDDLIKTDVSMLGVEAGYDYKFELNGDNLLYVGVMAGYLHNSDTETHQRNGQKAKGNGNAPSAGVYATWLAGKGFFADFAVRNFWAKMDMTNHASDSTAVTYKPEQNVISASIEAGKEFRKNFDNGNYLRFEPKAELMYTYANGKTVGTSTGANLKYDSVDHINGKLSVLLGYANKRANGLFIEPVIELAYNYEFEGKGDINYGGATYKSDLSGGTFEAALGLNMQINENIYGYLQGSYEKGKVVEGFGGNIGMRFGFGGS